MQALAINAFCGLCILTYVLSGARARSRCCRRGAARARRAAALGRSDGPAGARRVAARGARARGLRARGRGCACRAGRESPGAPARRARGTERPCGQRGAARRSDGDTGPRAAGRGRADPPPHRPRPREPQDARYWQQRAQQLQETLDDPRKLDAYFAQKAQHEYDTTQPVAIDLADTPGRGPAAAPVKVVEFSDFMCPFCRNLAGALAQFVPQAGGRVVVYFKNYPLDQTCNAKLPGSTHPGACNLALGSVCARRQGKFEAYHDKVFSTELHNPTSADVVRLAGEAGLNAQAVQGCLDDPKAKEALAADIAEGNRLGVSATPTLYVNGKKLPRINDFVAVVDKEARKKGFPPLAATQ